MPFCGGVRASPGLSEVMTRDLPRRLHPLCQGGSVIRSTAARAALATALFGALLAPGGSSPAAGTETLPAFRSTVRTIDAELAGRMTYTWRTGCPVPLRDLRYLRVSFVRFDGTAGYGRMVVHADVARSVVGVFRALYEQRFPIRRMRLVDAYRGSDDASMAANNTSAFNCRRVTGGTSWSEHSYGRAIDLNPIQNPYVAGSTVAPPAGAAYVDRSPLRKGMVTRGVRSAFASIGWSWGGSWNTKKDYQHFSATGR